MSTTKEKIMEKGDSVKLPPGVYRSRGTWTFQVRINGPKKHLYSNKDYEKVIDFAEKWHKENRSET